MLMRCCGCRITACGYTALAGRGGFEISLFNSTLAIEFRSWRNTIHEVITVMIVEDLLKMSELQKG
jgi:hypothetical protein